MPGNKSVEFVQYTDATIRDTIYEDEAETIVRDLTGYGTPIMRIGLLDPDITDTATTYEITGVITTPASGIVDFTITKAQTGALAPDKYNMQVVIVDGSGNEQTATNGYMTIRQALPDI